MAYYNHNSIEDIEENTVLLKEGYTSNFLLKLALVEFLFHLLLLLLII